MMKWEHLLGLKWSKCSKIVRGRKQKSTPWPVWGMGYNISSKKKTERLHGSICTQMDEWTNEHFKSWGKWEHFLYRKILVTKRRGIKEVGNHHFTATIITTDLGKNHQWMLKSLDERSLVKRVSTCSKSCVINHYSLQWEKDKWVGEKLGDTVLAKCSNLTWRITRNSNCSYAQWRKHFLWEVLAKNDDLESNHKEIIR